MSKRGGIFKVLGTGVGAVAEYNAHRKEKKALSRGNSEQDVASQQSAAGPSSQPQSADPSPSSNLDAPPAYEDAMRSGSGSSSQALASGGPPMGDKKAALAQYEDDYEDDAMYFEENATPLEVDDERVWDLDEATAREHGADSSSEDEATPHGREEDLVREVLESQRTALASAPGFEPTTIPVPVIIPQRRPRKKMRGFVHAYAPLLGECSGISQATFLLFLKNFYKSSQASPIFPIIMVAAGIAGMVPSVIAMAVTNAVQVAAGVGMEVQARQRTNSFLDKMNEGLFKPQGLFAMVVKYKSDKEVAQSGNSILMRLGVSGEKADLSTNQLIAKYDRSLSSESGGGKTMSERMQGLRMASDTTKGSVAMPAAAPLIFPEIDAAVAAEGEETFKAKMKDFHGFLADYLDRRGQVKYASDDPNSTLNLPSDQRAFKSKLADPNHPMYNGGIVGFVSGGKMSKGTRREDGSYSSRRDDRRMQRYEQRLDSGRGLSAKKERRYDDIRASRGYGSGFQEDAGYGRGVGQRGYGSGYEPDEGYGGRGFGRAGGRRRGGGGPIGLLVQGIGAAVDAAQKKNEPEEYRSREYEDSYDARLAPGGQREMRRSFDEREAGYGRSGSYGSYGGQSNAPAPHAPYGGQSSSSSQVPYGGQSNAPAPYGGRQQSYNRSDRRRGGGGGLIGTVKKVMSEDVLYLMIVPMPSEAELAEARETLARAKANK